MIESHDPWPLRAERLWRDDAAGANLRGAAGRVNGKRREASGAGLLASFGGSALERSAIRSFLVTPIGAAAGGLYLVFAAFAAWLSRQTDAEGPGAGLLGTVVPTLPNVVFVVAAVTLARSSSGRLRRCWALMAAAMLTPIVGDVVFDQLGQPPASIADVAFLASYPLMLAGILSLPFAAVGRRERVLFALDMSLVLTAAVTLTGYVLASSLGPQPRFDAATLVNLAYPALDILLLAAAVALVYRDVPGVSGTALGFLAAGNAASLMDSAVYASEVARAGSDPRVDLAAVYLGRALLATGAAWALAVPERESHVSRAREWFRYALPYLAGGASLLLLLIVVGSGARGGPLVGVALGTVAVAALALGRQYVVLRENLALNRELGRVNREVEAQAAVLERQNAQLKDHMRVQEEMEELSRHDIKTPLAGILAIPRLLLTPELGARERELLRLIERAGYRVLDLINLSLDLHRMERGSYAFQPRVVEIGEIVRRVSFDLKSHAASKGVRIVEQEGPGGGPRLVWAEELLSYSMLANLIKNALEAEAEGGTVRVAYQRSGDDLEIRIHNRASVPEPLRGAFFEKYVTSGRRGGTGLGTYSARLMAQTQRGWIAMASSEAEGTTVTVALKAAPAGALPQRSPLDTMTDFGSALPRAQELAPLRVLIVDDDPFNVAILQSCLPSPPLRVETAVNGQAGLTSFRRGGADVVLMDLEMPVMDGLEATARIRHWESTRQSSARALVIGLSAHQDTFAAERFLSAGADQYRTKPLPVDDLIAVLSDLSLRGRGASPSAAAVQPESEPATDVGERRRLPGIDLDRGLARVGGAEALYYRLLRRFHAANAARAGEVLEALARDDVDGATRLAHALKGSAATLSADRVSQVAASLEDALRHGRDAEPWAEELKEALAELGDSVCRLPDEQPASATEPQEPRAGVAREDLRSLRRQLGQNDLGALATFGRLAPGLRGPETAAELERLEGAIDELDFAAALESLDRIESRLRGVD